MSDTSTTVNPPPRVRIAPSPTGDPHVGTGYIGLFNYVFAKKHGGQFILRVEDTDRERSSRSSEEAIFEALRWLGLDWDEGPDKGGPHGPYRQSERLAIYDREVARLIESGVAYRCFCTRERLDALRKEQLSNKQRLGYDRHCRNLDAAESKRRADAGEPYVVRFKAPLEGQTTVHDQLRGEITFENEEIDDLVLMKSDGYPTYHLASVVDDHHMGITHVIRGEEWITSTPKHVLLYEAFGWEAPKLYHLGLLRNADKSKLSKRKNPVSIFHYRSLGYLPETFLNFLGTIGFSMGDDVERFTLDEMIANFDWSKVSVGGPVFDARKLEAFNGDDIRALDQNVLLEKIQERVLGEDRLRRLLALTQERINRLDDFIPYVSFFFGGTLDYAPVRPKLKIKKRTRKEVVDILRLYVEEIEKDPAARGFDADALETFSRGFCERHTWKTKEIFTLLRLAVSARMAAPPLFDTMALVGKDRARMRLRDLIEFLKREPDWS